MPYKSVMPDLPGLVKAPKAAELLGIPYGTLWWQIRNGAIRSEFIRGHHYILRAVIDAVLLCQADLKHSLEARAYYQRVAAEARENDRKITLARLAAAQAGQAPEETAEHPGS